MFPKLPHAIRRGLESYEPEHEWRADKLHVSDLAVAIEGDDGKCERQLWLRLAGVEPPAPTLGRVLMFDHGHRIHARMVELLDLGLTGGWRIVEVEHPVTIGHSSPVVGRLDVLLRGPCGQLVVLDFKTTRGRAFRYLDAPKPMHELQVQSYAFAVDAHAAVILYVDREGQNFIQQFNVERYDPRVKSAMGYAEGIRQWAIWYRVRKDAHLREYGPDYLPPKITVNENKGPDSVKLSLPWQCQYCDYLDGACPGALAPSLRFNGIVGHIHNDDFVPKNGCETIAPIVRSELEVSA